MFIFTPYLNSLGTYYSVSHPPVMGLIPALISVKQINTITCLALILYFL